MKRRGYLRIREEIELGLPGLVVWAYGKRGRYLGRVEINAAGLAAFTGKKGKKRLGNMSWETQFQRLDTRQE
jgi:hypothetical protein